MPRMELEVTVELELLEPPPQLIISAAVRKDSTGTSTRHLIRQIIKHCTMTAAWQSVKTRARNDRWRGLAEKKKAGR